MAASLGLIGTAAAGPRSAHPVEAIAADLSELRDGLVEAREQISHLQDELRRVREQVSDERAASFSQWKHERQELQRERGGLNREVQHLAHERAEVARVAAFHRARHPTPPVPAPGEPIAISDLPNRPRYAQPPTGTYPTPPATYIQPPFVFDNFFTPHSCLSFPTSPLIFRFKFHE